jgi:hypothetical protein
MLFPRPGGRIFCENASDGTPRRVWLLGSGCDSQARFLPHTSGNRRGARPAGKARLTACSAWGATQLGPATIKLLTAAPALPSPRRRARTECLPIADEKEACRTENQAAQHEYSGKMCCPRHAAVCGKRFLLHSMEPIQPFPVGVENEIER